MASPLSFAVPPAASLCGPNQGIEPTLVSSLKLKPRHRLTLVHLPPEILGMILAELDWKHVLRVRQTCRTLDLASRSWPVWYTIFHSISSDYDHPLPFAKNVPGMSTPELESSVTHWLRVEAGWLSKTKTPRRRTIGPCDDHWFHLVEGGRWLITSSLRHGCVSAYDLDSIEHQKYIIIRPEHRPDNIGVTRMYSLVYVVTLVSNSPQAQNPSRLSVWTVIGDQCNGRPRFSSTLVSSFNTHLNGMTSDAAIQGDFIAHEVLRIGADAIVIHDWKRSSSFRHHRSYIFPTARYNILRFLPDRRLLALNEDSAAIYAIPDCSDDLPSNTGATTTPLYTISLPALCFHGISPAYRDYAGDTRIMVGTYRGICELVIPPLDEPSTSVRVPLPKDRCYYLALGSRRALVVLWPGFHQKLEAMTVSLCQGASIFGEVRPWPIHKRPDYQPLIDEVTGRIVEICQSRGIVTFDYATPSTAFPTPS